MGKNHRHKKNLKADKAKTQLKQTKTKFLPKGLNVTDTSFKIKSIIIPQQLKEQEQDVPLSKRKLNIKDLLTRIRHYNDNVRNTACEELSEMMKFHSEEIISQHLGQVILDISTLMQDRERKVRKSAVKAVDVILHMTKAEKIYPFYNYFSTNLRCAMTNIDRNIQEDSLLFLDSLLKHNANLVATNAEKLLPDFFTLISKIRSDSNLDRTLTVNLKSKITSVTWRIRVLSRLHCVLESILNMSDGTRLVSTEGNIHLADQSSSFPIYRTSFNGALESSDYKLCNISSDNLYKQNSLNKHILTLVPLLYETFLEVVPEKKIKKSMNDYTALNEEATAVLSCVMSTLFLLWKYTQQLNTGLNTKDIFLSKEGKKFLDHLLLNFPYCKSDSESNKKTAGAKLIDSTTDSKCTKENILICYIYSVLNVVSMKRYVKSELDAIFYFISKYLLTKRCNNPEVFGCLMEFLRLSLIANPKDWKRAGTDNRTVLENTIIFYNNNLNNESCKVELFNLLLEVVNIPFLNRLPAYGEFLTRLPKFLCKSEITDTEVQALLKLSRINNETFHKSLVREMPSILANLNNLNIVITKPTLLNCEENVKKQIAYIFFYVPNIRDHDKLLLEFMSNYPESSYCEYFYNIMDSR